MFRILFTHTPEALALQFPQAARDRIAVHGEVVLNPGGAVLSAGALAEAARGCDLLIADRQTAVCAEALAGMSQVMAVMRCAVDIRTIDVDAASEHGILVTRSIPSFANSVAELAIGLMLDGARGISDAVLDHRAGRAPMPRPGWELAGGTLGIVGFGVIGRKLATLGLAFGMHVVICDPDPGPLPEGVERRDFSDLLGQADVVVCLVPATESTHGLFGASAFAAMRREAMFMNLARGELVDEAALEAALDAGRIACAAMDVGMAADQRPSPRLAGRADVLATPHIGGQTPQAIEGQAFHVASQVAEIAAGRMPAEAVNIARATRFSAWAAQGRAI